MSLFLVHYEHSDLEIWHAHRETHRAWLHAKLEEGILRASGPCLKTDIKSAVLIVAADSAEETEALLADDPFVIHGVVTAQTITEWDPLFGEFNADSSQPNHAERQI